MKFLTSPVRVQEDTIPRLEIFIAFVVAFVVVFVVTFVVVKNFELGPTKNMLSILYNLYKFHTVSNFKSRGNFLTCRIVNLLNA